MYKNICFVVGCAVMGCGASHKTKPVAFGGATANSAKLNVTDSAPDVVAPSLSEVAERWHRLVDDGKKDEAKTYCKGLLKLEEAPLLAEGHKCLANVALMENQVVRLDHNDGEVSFRDGYHGTALDRAVAHLDQAATLAPQDLSVHQGRLHLLLDSGSISRFVAALKDSCEKYESEDALEEWLPYVSELFNAENYEGALEALSVLDKQYPSSHKVIANMGVAYAMTDNLEKALALTRKAVELAPDDPLNAWNMGRFYELSQDLDKARELYEKSIALEQDPDTISRKQCMLGQFLVETKVDKKAGCALTAEHCHTQVEGCE